MTVTVIPIKPLAPAEVVITALPPRPTTCCSTRCG
jgi:hypothetical protein